MTIFSFSFFGTIGRLQYLGAIALQMLVMFIVAFTVILVMEANPEAGFTGPMAIFSGLIIIPSAVWGWSIAARRMRDTGANPWWVLTLLIPYVQWFAMAILLLVPAGSFGRKELPVAA